MHLIYLILLFFPTHLFSTLSSIYFYTETHHPHPFYIYFIYIYLSLPTDYTASTTTYFTQLCLTFLRNKLTKIIACAVFLSLFPYAILCVFLFFHIKKKIDEKKLFLFIIKKYNMINMHHSYVNMRMKIGL